MAKISFEINSKVFLLGTLGILILPIGYLFYNQNFKPIPKPSFKPSPVTESSSPSPSLSPSLSPSPSVNKVVVPSANPVEKKPGAGNFPIQQLQIISVDPVWTGTSENPVPFLNVDIQNNSDRAATNVKLKINFYYQESGGSPYDTKYVTLLGVANPGKSTLRGNVPGFKSNQDNIWYETFIIGASYN